MPSLLEKPAGETASSTLPLRVIRSRFQWERWRGILFCLFVGLTGTLVALWAFHPSLQSPGSWTAVAGIWVGGLFLTGAGIVLSRHFSPSSWLDVAQEMDRNLVAKNRLEASAILRASTSPLAEAQREETSTFLRQQGDRIKPVWMLPWFVAGILLLIVAHLATLAIWVIPMFHHADRVVPPASKESALPKASIIWQSPEAESRANPIEEVPTVAVAQSTSGLANMSLEVSVNGALKKSIPLPAQPFDQPGKNTVKTSLFMDELGVAPFDVVSYFIRARRKTEQKVPDTTSPIQFIQVRPFRDDVAQMPDSEGTRNFNLLLELKLAQLSSVQQNFVLAHTDLAANSPVRISENKRVGENQAQLSKKTEEIVQAFIEDGYPADMIDLLRQAEPPMDDAAQKILAIRNNEALPSQEKALELIVEVEKFFQKAMSDKSKGAESPLQDPFKDKQQHELKKRSDAAAGQLEQLAKNQSQLAHDLNQTGSNNPANSPAEGTGSAAGQPTPETPDTRPGDGSAAEPPSNLQAVDPFGPDADKGTLAERQTRVVQGIETLLNTNTPLPPAVNQALQDARKDASESMTQLNQGDENEAREPAAAAAQELQKAVLEMNRSGEEDARQAMEEGQEKLNDLARQLRDLAQKGSPDAPQALNNLAREVANIRKQLEAAADKQETAGSAEGAQSLQRLAQAISDKNVENDLAGMSKTGLDASKARAVAQTLQALAEQAAQGTASAKPSAQDLAHLIDALEKSRANLDRLAQMSGGSQPATGDGKQASPGQSPSPEKSGDQGQGNSNSPGSSPSGQNAPGSRQPQTNPPPTTVAGLAGGIGTDSQPQMTEIGQAYRDVIADLRDETERIGSALPTATPPALTPALDQADQSSRDHPVTGADIAHTDQVLSDPLDKLISNLVEEAALLQREEIVKQPDLDEAPAAYRSAVSDYFETMSRDYHPDHVDQNPPHP